MAGKVQHQPWESSHVEQVQVVDGVFVVDGLEHIEFSRKNWKYGGYEAFAVCKWCGENVKAGGGQGEKNVIRWGYGHRCDAPKPEYEVDEDKKLFRH